MMTEEDAKVAAMDVGPISLDFEVPMYVCSGLNIRFLRCLDRGRQYSPFRWVRYITHRCVPPPHSDRALDLDLPLAVPPPKHVSLRC